MAMVTVALALALLPVLGPQPAMADAAEAPRLPRVAEALRQAGASGGGSVSEADFLSALRGRSVEERMAWRAVGEDAGRKLFAELDLDASGGLDAAEAARAVDAAQMLASDLTAEQPGTGGAGPPADDHRRLAAAVSKKTPLGGRLGQPVHDSRCAAPVGFPNRPEGFICLNQTDMIYCSKGYRLTHHLPCHWQGVCKAGTVGVGGCIYPMCYNRQVGGTFCHQGTVFSCRIQTAHGRHEMASLRLAQCKAGSECHQYDEGMPPARRRRTKTCSKFKHYETCSDDPAPPSWAACFRDGCNSGTECMV